MEINKHIVSELESIAKKVYSGDPKSCRRLRPNVDARIAIFTILQKQHTHTAIGKFYGVDTSTVSNLLKRHNSYFKTNISYRTKYELFQSVLNTDEIKKKLAVIAIKTEVNRLNLELYSVGFSTAEVLEFWRDNIIKTTVKK